MGYYEGKDLQMISINYATFFIIYLGVTILGIGIVTLYSAMKYNRYAKITAEDRYVVACPVCAYRYIIGVTDIIHTCPQCQSLNKK